MWIALLAPRAHAETIGERELLQRVATHPDIVAAERAVALIQAGETRATLNPNPSLAWNREHFPGDEREDVLSLTVPIDVSGRSSAARSLVRSEAASARAGAARIRAAVAARALDAFYAALAAEQRVKVARAALARLERAGAILARRQSEGVVAGSDVKRVELELELSRAELERERAELAGLRAQLAFLVRSDERTLVLRAALRPELERPRPDHQRRSVRAARAAIEQARRARDAARRAWLPSVELSVGLRIGTADADETRYGYVAGVAVELPIWSRGQDLSEEAAARQELALSEAHALEHSATLEQLAAERELSGALAELERLRGVARQAVDGVVRAAESSYAEGARPLSELLDAHALAAELERRRIDAELRVRRAQVRLRAARGDFE